MTLTSLQEVINALDTPVLLCNTEAEYVLYNSAFSAFYPSQLSLQASLNTVFKPHSFNEIKEILSQPTSRKDHELFLEVLDDSNFLLTEWKITYLSDNNLFMFQLIAEREKHSGINIQKYKLLAENAYDINIMFEGLDVLFISPSIHEYLGYFERDFSNMKIWHDLIHPEDRAKWLLDLGDDDKRGIPFSFFNYRIKHNKGHYIWLEVKVRRERAENGKTVNILTAMDITKRKKAEHKLTQQKAFIEQLFDAIPNLIYVKDENNRITYCNKAVEDLCGIQREVMIGAEGSFLNIIYPNKEIYDTIEHKSITSSHEIILEEKILDQQLEEHYFQTIKKPILQKDGNTHLLSVSTNINRIKFYQHESERAMQEKNEFFSVMSHEVRTPINAIIGLTDILIGRSPRTDQKEILSTLKFSTNNLNALVNDVLDYQKIDAGEQKLDNETFNFRNLLFNIEKSYEAVLRKSIVNFKLNIGDTVPTQIIGDELKISQILNNLVNNAVKFTNYGEICLTVNAKQRKNVPDKTQLLFELSDTGMGIDEAQLKYIFKPFQQVGNNHSKQGGTGLGLSIVQKLVKLHQGKIEVSSTPGQGTTFEFDILVNRTDKIGNMGQFDFNNSIKEDKLNMSVLYVEDVTTNQYLIEEILQDWGVKVSIASDGFEAINLVQETSFDVILMDLQMPGIDGFETTKQVKKILKGRKIETPIIALSAGEEDNLLERIKSAGMKMLLAKPINTRNLYNALQKYSTSPKFTTSLQLSEDRTRKQSCGHQLNFMTTDKIFSDSKIRYKEYLHKIVDEFNSLKNEMIQAIHEKDLEQVRRVNHKMKSTVTTLNMNDLSTYIAELKQKVASPGIEYSPSSEEKKFTKQVDAVQERLNQKIISLQLI